MYKIIVASGPVIVEDNKVLLNQHGDTDFWKFCGGRAMDDSEGLREIAERRVKEELGIGIEILDEAPFFLYLTSGVKQIINRGQVHQEIKIQFRRIF